MWLYERDALRWDSLQPETQSWQRMRLRDAAIGGYLFAAATERSCSDQVTVDIVGLGHLQPPRSDWRTWNPFWWWQWTKFRVCQILYPTKEGCCNEQVIITVASQTIIR